MDKPPIDWILSSPEPWTRYRLRLDLLGDSPQDEQPQKEYREILAHPKVKALLQAARSWPGDPLSRHNDTGHVLYKLVVLADFGLNQADFDIGQVADNIFAHQSPDGAFCSLMNISTSYGGSGQDSYAWMGCDAPTLIYVLLKFGYPADGPVIQRALDHLLGLAGEKGWGCSSGGAGRFRGPGRKEDPCPIADLLALKAISCVPGLLDSPQAHWGVEMLLRHWELRREKKYYLFGMGTDFSKLKYPFVWYDILHVADVIRHFPFALPDPRFQGLLDTIAAQKDRDNRFTARSMYLAWKDWSFADKKNPSQWITLLAWRCIQNLGY